MQIRILYVTQIKELTQNISHPLKTTKFIFASTLIYIILKISNATIVVQLSPIILYRIRLQTILAVY